MLRLGVVGHGHRISNVIKMFLRSVEPDLRVVGIVDTNQEYAMANLDQCDRDDVVFYEDLDQMVRKAKLDGLAIGTNCPDHTPYAIQAAKYDIPLYLEKPVSTTMEQATALETAFENSKCPVIVSFPLVVSSLSRQSKEMIDSGAIDRPEHIMAWTYSTICTHYFDKQYRIYKNTQGLFIQKATHDFNYIEYLMGSPIVNIAGMWTRGNVWGGNKPAGLYCSKCDEQDECLESPQNRKKNNTTGMHEDHPCDFSVDIGNPKDGMNEDSSSVMLKFATGAHGVYTQVFFVRNKSTRGARITGYKGSVNFDWYTSQIDVVHHHKPFVDTYKTEQLDGHHGGDYVLARAFVDMIQKNIQPPNEINIHAGVQSVYTCLAAKQSCSNNEFIKVRRVGDVN
jgi:predicted dehydrogenase